MTASLVSESGPLIANNALPELTPAGIVTLIWFKPCNPGAIPAYATVAGIPPTVTEIVFVVDPAAVTVPWTFGYPLKSARGSLCAAELTITTGC
jgi:hypothetical protein